MEKKPPKLKNKILKYLPKAASVVYFHNPPFSPSREKRSDSYFHHRVKPQVAKGFSGPIVSIIPREARRKTKNGGGESSFYTQEPTSPKISCMGQIKHKKKTMNKNDHVQETKPVSSPQIKKQGSTIKKLFGGSSKPEGRRRSDACVYDNQPLSAGSVDRAPGLSQMKRFASGRDAFVNFDWSAQIAPVESDHRDYYSDEDVEIQSEEEEMRIPFSAPIMVGPALTSSQAQPRKEINLWKRRTMDPPKPLQLNLMVRSS